MKNFLTFVACVAILIFLVAFMEWWGLAIAVYLDSSILRYRFKADKHGREYLSFSLCLTAFAITCHLFGWLGAFINLTCIIVASAVGGTSEWHRLHPEPQEEDPDTIDARRAEEQKSIERSYAYFDRCAAERATAAPVALPGFENLQPREIDPNV